MLPCATAGTRPHSRVPSLLHLAAIACFRRATAGTRLCVGKHSVRAFHPSAHAGLLSALSAMEGGLAFACCENVVVVGRRPTTRRIKSYVLIEVFWFGRIASGEPRIYLQMAYGLRENFVGASGTTGWRISIGWSLLFGTTTACTTSQNFATLV